MSVSLLLTAGTLPATSCSSDTDTTTRSCLSDDLSSRDGLRGSIVVVEGSGWL